MTYSIFDGAGNLVDAFADRDTAVAALRAIARAEPETANDVVLVAQDDHGRMVGDAICGSAFQAAALPATAPGPGKHDGSLVEACDVATRSPRRLV